MAKNGHKSLRNVPEMYDEVKKSVSVSLTKTAVKKLDILANKLGLSRSEMIEQIARGIIRIQINDC